MTWSCHIDLWIQSASCYTQISPDTLWALAVTTFAVAIVLFVIFRKKS